MNQIVAKKNALRRSRVVGNAKTIIETDTTPPLEYSSPCKGCKESMVCETSCHKYMDWLMTRPTPAIINEG
jgi:hypothetical protein